MLNEDHVAENIGEDIARFMMGLANEGQRSAVVLGAARCDVALERLLKKVTMHHPDGADNLFDPDRPLGSFSAKISLCYRLGLIDRHLEHALQMLRRTRNEFAHATSVASLSESHHKARVEELIREAQKTGPLHSEALKHLAKVQPDIFRGFCAAIAVMVTYLEIAVLLNEELKPVYVAELTSDEVTSVGD